MIDEAVPLVPLPEQPAGVPWPTRSWPLGPVPRGVPVDDLLEQMFSDTATFGVTYAVVIVHHGRLVAERYGGALEHWDRPAETVGPETRLLSWSKAKSVLHAVVGMLVGDRRLDVSAPAPVPEWRADGDPRAEITLEHLLCMRDGLDFAEDYVDAQVSDVIEMLFGSGASDVAHFAASRPLAAPPGARFNYSSGTSNVVSGVVARALGGRHAYESFLRDRLFTPLGMTSATPTFDDAGTWVASSYLHATARDFARFGYLYLRDGVWDGVRLLPAGWVDHARRPRSVDPEDGRLYGAHWWVTGDQHGSFWANGYEGQSTLVSPACDLVVVRLGKSTKQQYGALAEWRGEVVSAFTR